MKDTLSRLPLSLGLRWTRADLGIRQILTAFQHWMGRISLCYECKVSYLLHFFHISGGNALHVSHMERISIINKLQFIPSSDIPALWITASSPSAGKELKWPWARYLAFGRGLSMLCKRNGKNTGHLHNLKDDEQFCEVFVCPLNFVNYCMK